MTASPKLLVCVQQRYAPNPVCCANHGSQTLRQVLQSKLEAAGLLVEIAESGCLGMCGMGPNLKHESTGRIWNRVTYEMLDEVVQFLVLSQQSRMSTT